MMKLTVNGKLHDMEVLTLETLLQELGYQDATIATALNGDFIPATQRQTTFVKDNDRVEILAPMKGG